MSKDLCGALNDKWWVTANSAENWKSKYDCMQTVFKILTGNEKTNVEIKCNISDHKKANDLMKILTNWLMHENHIFTRIAILRIMPKLIQSFPKKTLTKHQNQLIETILTKQWTEKKKPLLDLVTPCLIQLWLKTGIELKSDEFKPFLISALKHHGKEARYSACDFIAKCTMFIKRKKQILALCQNKEIGLLLGKLAMNDRESIVKLAGCKAMYGLNQMGIIKSKKVSKELINQYDQLLNNTRGKKNLDAAINEYKTEINNIFNIYIIYDKIKKVKKKEEIKVKTSNIIIDDEKIECGKKYKRVIKKMKKLKPKPGSGTEFKKGIGGKLLPHGVERTKHKAKKPKTFEEGKPIDKKSLEDNKKALIAATKFKVCNIQNAFKKLETWCKDEQDSLKKTVSVSVRVGALEIVAKNIKKANKYNDIYDAIIALAGETMGWNGNDARNPMLAKICLILISDCMANSDVKDSGMFTIYLEWVLERLSENKFNKLATKCLLSTCYQYSSKVVFSIIEKLLFEPKDILNDPFKNEKCWHPIIKFIGDAVIEFGVDNFYVCRLINIIHQKIVTARNIDAKESCYYALTQLYKQLGDDWCDILLSLCTKPSKKSMNIKFKKCINPGVYTQLRCTKKEKLPPPQGMEMEIYEEEIEQWVEIVQQKELPLQPELQPEPEPEIKEEEKEQEIQISEEKEIEPEPEATPPPAQGPLISNIICKKYRLSKCKKLNTLWEQSKPLYRNIIQEYDGQIIPKNIDKNHPGIFNDLLDSDDEYKCGDMEKWKKEFSDKKNSVKKWKPIVESMCLWIANFEGTKFFKDIVYCTDLMLYWANIIYIENTQPNVCRMMMKLWKQLMESYAESEVKLGEIEGKMILPIVCNKTFNARNTTQMGMELCELIEYIYPPAICYKIYLSTIEKTKSNMVKLNCMIRLGKSISDYGLIKCDLKKYKLKCKPFASPKDFVIQFIKQYLKLKDKKTINAAKDILKYCYEVVGDRIFWRECKVRGAQKDNIMTIIEDVEQFKKGEYREPEKQWIGDLIKEKKKVRLAALKALKTSKQDGNELSIDDDVPIQSFPGQELAEFTPLKFTPQQLLALKYGPSPHSWKMNNLSNYVSRLPSAFCMDWNEFENDKTTVNIKPIAPYIKVGNVRIDVESGQEIIDGNINIYASMLQNKENEEKEFLIQTQKDDEIMSNIFGVERDNAEYFDTNNDGSSWLTFDVNGFDETDRQIQLIKMRNIYGVKSLQTWLNIGKNINIIQSNVNGLLNVLLPWLKDLINTKTLLSDNQRYQHTYQILQLLKFCSQFKTLKQLNKSQLMTFFKVLLGLLTYDNINTLFGYNYKRILGEINNVLIQSVLNTSPTDTLCVLISLLKECNPIDDSQSSKQYADACCKLIYKVIKKYDKIIFQNNNAIQAIYIEIIQFFTAISYETWQMAETHRRFPLKIMQMIIARLIWFCGNNNCISHLNIAIKKLQNGNINGINDAAIYHQRYTYAKRLIMNFINVCQNKRLKNKTYKNQSYKQDEYEKNKPYNIKQAQSVTNNNYMKPLSEKYEAKSTLQNVYDANNKAIQYAKKNKIDMNFALWIGMTGRNKHDYVNHITHF